MGMLPARNRSSKTGRMGQTARCLAGEEEDGWDSGIDWNLRHSWEWGHGEQGH
jgi:hypothetical protein